MFIEILLFIAAGIGIGTFFGLVPGLHPNMIILFIPLLFALNLSPIYLIAFVVTMAITNSVVFMIPSVLLGAPDAGSELGVLPGHKMLMKGFGYDAIKLTVIGSFGAVLVSMALVPVLVIFLSDVYGFIRPALWVFLSLIVFIMIWTEPGNKKMTALFVFFAAGLVGIFSNSLPLNNITVLFPVLSGFFGIPYLALQVRKKTEIPKQSSKPLYVSKKTINRSVLLGSLGGIFAGFLPGVGSSQIVTLATVDKNDYSFLTTLGALTTANILISILSIWLISHARSGAAVILENLVSIGPTEFMFILIIAVISISIASMITLVLARRFVHLLQKINYTALSKMIIFIIFALAFIFAGMIGIFLLAVCSALGIFTNLAGIKRGCMMGVLILPVILFFLGI